MTFHLMRVHIIISSVSVDEWPNDISSEAVRPILSIFHIYICSIYRKGELTVMFSYRSDKNSGCYLIVPIDL